MQQLEDEGLIRAEADDGGRRAYQLTDEGRAYAEAHPDELRAPWDVFAGAMGDTTREMRSLIGQVAMAAYQVLSAGTESQATQARQEDLAEVLWQRGHILRGNHIEREKM